LWLNGFVTSAANPKAVVFFAALFPQFLDPQQSLVPQIAVLGVTYIVIDGCFPVSFSKSSSWIAKKLQSKHEAWVERAAGVGLLSAAVLLDLSTNE
jgi:threonine/homoserine/homoserine lactone efflux protein